MLTLTVGVLGTVGANAQPRSGRIDPTAPPSQGVATIFGESIVAHEPGRYIGWPSVAVTQSGDLLAVFSGDRDWHVGPWGKIQMVRSADGGKTWSEPRTIIDTPLDDRDAGIVVMHDGTVLVSFNASLVFATSKDPRYRKYDQHAATIDRATRDKWRHQWVFRSTDDGRTFQPAGPAPTGTPHGPTLLKDGRLLMVRPEVYESIDAGISWRKIASIAQPEDWHSTNAFLSEQHAVEAADGSIVALARYRDAAHDDQRLREIISTDGGHTWSAPVPTPIVGYPAHLLRLHNGWLVATYSRRIAPMGERACISKDNGRTWLTDREIVLSNASPQPTIDLGYPCSAQLPDGSIFTVYYQTPPGGNDHMPALMGTHWRIDTPAGAGGVSSRGGPSR